MDRQEVDKERKFIANYFTGVYTYNTTSVLVQHRGLYNVTSCTMSLLVQCHFLYNSSACTMSLLVQQQFLYNVIPCTMLLFVLDTVGCKVSRWILVGSVECHPTPSSVSCKSCRSTTSVSSSYQELELSIEGRETLEDSLVAFFKVASTLPLQDV